MNFFQKIFDLSHGVDLSLKIKRKNDKLTVSVLPGNSNSIQPLVVTGTPAELDEGIDTLFVKPIADVKGLISNEADFKKSAEEQTDKAKQVATAKSTKPAKEPKPKKEKPAKVAKEKTAKKNKTASSTAVADPPVEEQPSAQPTFF